MPQMAPMMWQMIYLTMLTLMIMIVTKSFFLTVQMMNKMMMISTKKNEIYWKW